MVKNKHFVGLFITFFFFAPHSSAFIYEPLQPFSHLLNSKHFRLFHPHKNTLLNFINIGRLLTLGQDIRNIASGRHNAEEAEHILRANATMWDVIMLSKRRFNLPQKVNQELIKLRNKIIAETRAYLNPESHNYCLWKLSKINEDLAEILLTPQE